MRSVHGVGFTIRTSLLCNIPEMPVGVNERLMPWCIRLGKVYHLTIFSAYAPTLEADETKDRFYSILEFDLLTVPSADRVGSNYEICDKVLGKHGVGKVNSNGLRLLMRCQNTVL